MEGFTICARVYGSGRHEITVSPGRRAASRAHLNRRVSRWTDALTGGPYLTDWQVAEADTLAEARRTIMLAFGMGWFNRARKRLRELES